MSAINADDEYVRRAYTRLRKSSWEGGIQEAIEHPLRGPIIAALARELRERRVNPPRTDVPPPPAKRELKLRKLPAIMDRKRAASGERDDD